MIRAMRDRNRLLLASFIVFAILTWILSLIADHRSSSQTASTSSSNPTGLKAFAELKERMAAGSAVAHRRAFLHEKDLLPFDSIFLVSLKTPVSPRETELIEGRVKKGARLIVAFHDEASQKLIAPFLDLAGIKAPVTDVPGFKNGRTARVEAKADDLVLKAGESYEFYSRLRFQDSQCAITPIACYFRASKVGQGEIIAIAGVPPFANAMLSRSSNNRLASRLALVTGKTAFDEYHLLFTEKTLGDLLLDPSFILPALGLLIGLLLFFLLGSGDYEEKLLAEPTPSRSRSFHQFNRQILRRVLETPGSLREACLLHARYLEHLMPKDAAQIRELASEERDHRLANKLVKFHQDWLKSRGRK